MIAAALIVILVLLIGTVAVAVGVRSMVRQESNVESRLRAPNAHAVAYTVPNGVDPADLRVAVARAGFAGVIATTSGTRQCLLIECEEADRPRLRHVVENAMLVP